MNQYQMLTNVNERCVFAGYKVNLCWSTTFIAKTILKTLRKPTVGLARSSPKSKANAA